MNEQETTAPQEPEAPEATAEEQAVVDDIQALYDKLQEISDERDQMRDQALRTMADFQNFRKRNQAEAVLLKQFATESMVSALLPVLDNFDRTIAHIDSGATVESLTAGVKAVERQLRSVLESQNVTRIQSLGQPFDPELHEAIGTDESDQPEDTITTEIAPGYKMADRVIRPAQVKVAKKG